MLGSGRGRVPPRPLGAVGGRFSPAAILFPFSPRCGIDLKTSTEMSRASANVRGRRLFLSTAGLIWVSSLSQNGSGWKRPQGWSNLLPQAGSSQSVWHKIAIRWFWNTPVTDTLQPFWSVCFMCGHQHNKDVLPYTQVEFPVLQFLHVVSCPIAGQHCEEPGSIHLRYLKGKS